MGNLKSSLSLERRRLLGLFQLMNFGRIELLEILRGEPVLSPAPRIVREFKFGGEQELRPSLRPSDFLLKRQVVELFNHFDELQDGTIEVLEVRNGLPFRMAFSDVHF